MIYLLNLLYIHYIIWLISTTTINELYDNGKISS